jgi:hypothetical protein
MDTLKRYKGVVSDKPARNKGTLHRRDDVLKKRSQAVNQTLRDHFKDDIVELIGL